MIPLQHAVGCPCERCKMTVDPNELRFQADNEVNSPRTVDLLKEAADQLERQAEKIQIQRDMAKSNKEYQERLEIERDDALTELEEWRSGKRHHVFGNVLDHYEQLPNDLKSDPGFDNLRSAIAGLFDFVEKRSPWRSVKDDPPAKGADVILATKKFCKLETWGEHERAIKWTHWMPFVEPEDA